MNPLRRHADDLRLFCAGVSGYIEACANLHLLPTPRAALRAGLDYLATERKREHDMRVLREPNARLDFLPRETDPRLLDKWRGVR